MSIKFLILDKLASVGECSLEMLMDIFDIGEAMLSSYPEAYRKLKRSREHYVQLLDREELKSKINLSNMLSKLKKEGLVINKKRGFWSLTKKGVKKFKTVSKENQLERWENEIRNQARKTKQEINKKENILIVFDIPEDFRRERAWLRTILRALNFKPLQKSVWIGEEALPEEFFEALRNLKLLSYIEVFTVNKKGTINVKER